MQIGTDPHSPPNHDGGSPQLHDVDMGRAASGDKGQSAWGAATGAGLCGATAMRLCGVLWSQLEHDVMRRPTTMAADDGLACWGQLAACSPGASRPAATRRAGFAGQQHSSNGYFLFILVSWGVFRACR